MAEDRFAEYQLRIKKILAPMKTQYDFISIPTAKNFQDYQLLFEKLQNNGENFQPISLKKQQAFQENRCIGITQRGVRCANGHRCLHHENP